MWVFTRRTRMMIRLTLLGVMLAVTAFSYSRAADLLNGTAEVASSGQAVDESVPAPFRDTAKTITQGYEDAYFGPIRETGDLVENPNGPEPQVVLPPGAEAVQEQLGATEGRADQ